MEKQKASIFDKANLVVTVFGVLMTAIVAWASWSVNSKVSNIVVEERLRNTEIMNQEHAHNIETFVAKPWFQASHDELIRKLDENKADTTKKFDALTVDVSGVKSDVGTVKESVAEIKGQLSVKPK